MRIFNRLHEKLNWSTGRYFSLVLGALFLGYVASAIYQANKPMPEGLDYTGPLRHADVQFLADETYIDANGKQQLDQHIFDQALQMIKEAQNTIVLDMFLFNSSVGDSKLQQRPMSEQLTQALIQKRLSNQNMDITVITDPINTAYGGTNPENFAKLRQSGIDVIPTDLTGLRASNPVWSGFWYLCCQGIQNNPDAGWLNNPVGDGKVTLRSYMSLLNFKANHRKTLLVDTADGWKTLVSSQNPHDGSSRHSNVGLLVTGYTAVDVLKTEQTVAQFSQSNTPFIVIGNVDGKAIEPQVQVLTEQAILKSVLNMINTAKSGDQIDLAMFYLSERQIIKALISAKERGIKLRVLLDPNKDAFGRQKNGIPNRQVAKELYENGIDVRWCDTHGEQCHSKMILKHNSTSAELILGSANFTARNLKNYNLETDLRVIGTANQKVFVDANQYFDRNWQNLDGRHMSVEYAKYADDSSLKYWLYRFMEWSGLSTF
ncbi:phospholipase D-like domain-containing protein [Acinetobacter gerneri]|uniref:phospholipase D-like domain-containing protein n=1 Tax=Acinetobacter gerneri TaxID=202952 RepID=UPI0029356DD3|nr:phospholipase D-like domain-containing protein [Acinetobacter gerneri]MDV2441941.1 phospholipase D-like domain-containing protein [Acinetobacter gerneri]